MLKYCPSLMTNCDDIWTDISQIPAPGERELPRLTSSIKIEVTSYGSDATLVDWNDQYKVSCTKAYCFKIVLVWRLIVAKFERIFQKFQCHAKGSTTSNKICKSQGYQLRKWRDFNRLKWPVQSSMHSYFKIDLVWGRIVTTFEQIFQKF